MKRLCDACHTLGGCWDAPRLVHGETSVGPCDWCGAVDICVKCYAYDFRKVTSGP